MEPTARTHWFRAPEYSILSDIKAINSYVLEVALDDVVEKKWDSYLEKFITQMEETAPLNGVDGIRQIELEVVFEVVKMILFLICRNPEFDFLGIFPALKNFFLSLLPGDNEGLKKDFMDKQMDGVWLKELYNGLFGIPKGYIHTLKTTAQDRFQIVLFKVWEDQGSFISSDTPAFEHISLVEAKNFNSIICPLTPQYLLMLMNGERNSLRDVDFRRADNDLIKRFNRIILSHAQNAIVSDHKHLGYIL